MPKVTGCGEIEEIERGKVYRIRHHLGRDPKTGRYLRSPKRTVHGTKSDARRALEEYRRELEEGFANPENLTVPELGWRWHEQRKLLKDLSPLTHATDECELKKGSRIYDIYGTGLISERHRHRYEFNSDFLPEFEKAGMTASGRNPQTGLVEVMEIPSHPFFVGVQFHPEFKSTPEHPQPIFTAFVKAAIEKRGKKD